jgi:hypothetical protein
MGIADLFLDLSILSALCVLLFYIMIFIIIFTMITVFIWLPAIFYAVDSLGQYPPLLEKKRSSKSTQKGDTFMEKYIKVIFANIIIGISLFITLIFTFNTLPQIFVEKPAYQNLSINIPYTNFIYPIPMTPSILSSTDIAFFLTLIVIPIFLHTLRVLANPRKKKIVFTNFDSLIQSKGMGTEKIKRQEIDRAQYFSKYSSMNFG